MFARNQSTGVPSPNTLVVKDEVSDEEDNDDDGGDAADNDGDEDDDDVDEDDNEKRASRRQTTNKGLSKYKGSPEDILETSVFVAPHWSLSPTRLQDPCLSV